VYSQITTLIPILLQKAINDKMFIKKEAQACLVNISTNAVSDDLVHILTQECASRSGPIAEKAYETLSSTYDRLSLTLLLDVCFELFDNKRNSIKTHVVNVMKSNKSSSDFTTKLDTIESEKRVLVEESIKDK
jgi:hypothetical protein